MTIMAPVEVGVAARLFHGLGDSTRLSILLVLLGGERRVTDLAAEVGRAQATVSEHLFCLRGCGLVTVRTEGRASWYALAGEEVVGLLRAAEVLLAARGDHVALCGAQGRPTPADGRS